MNSKFQTEEHGILKNLLKSWIEKGLPTEGNFLNIDNDIFPLFILRLFCSIQSPRVLCVFPNSAVAETQFLFFKNARNEFPYLREDCFFLPELLAGAKFPTPDLLNKVACGLRVLVSLSPGVFFTSSAALVSQLPAKFAKTPSIVLECGKEINMEDLCNCLVKMNYADEYEASSQGEFSRRGGLIDIFSPSEKYPARIDFFGNRLEGIRLYDPVTQRSISKKEQYEVTPVFDFSSEDTAEEMLNLSDFFTDRQTFVIIFHPEECRSHLRRFFGEKKLNDFEKLTEQSGKIVFLLDSLESAEIKGEDCSKYSYSRLNNGATILSKDDALKKSFGTISRFLSEQFSVFVGVRDDESVGYIREMLLERGISDLRVEKSILPHSFVIEELKLVFITEDDLLALPVRRLPHFSEKIVKEMRKISTGSVDFFSDFDEGDYVVHNDYGIGIFKGIVVRNFAGIENEVLQIEFADDTITYTDIHRADLVSKYSGAGKMQAKLSVIGRRSWNKEKILAKRGAAEFAAGLLRIQAARMAKTGFQMKGNRSDERLFEKKFPFTETPDQRKATEEIFKDMKSDYPMDRLLCGDAGYGKTEVAMRAAFRAVISGKQVAVLVPTTVLAQQHYYSFTERFSEYPIVIEMLSRFRTHREQNDALRRLAEGSIDIIIGTHRLLQKDVRFKNLGLLIIDEEQRFGVEHKENFKKMREMIDLLSMSATPIPRTLYMAMTGIRDLSTISTPPSERLPVLSYVAKQDSKVLSNAINFEIERGGQVFYLHNRVKTINSVVENLAKIAPGSTIGIAHGQMNEEELEQQMLAFLQGKTQILCCTTIIESGIDVPNANTLIVERADRFGLAELYQLKGRVGRSGRQGYAYFLLPPDMQLTSNAKDRISAVKKHGELGAGFKIALRDLEIRGSGNIIGTEQSGYINSVGFELYCHYLRMAAAELRGEKLLNLEFCDIFLDFLIFGRSVEKKSLIEAFIPLDYIESEKLRVKFYRQIAFASNFEKLSDILSDMYDRFGKTPKEVLNLIEYQKLKITLLSAGYNRLYCRNDLLEICEIRNGKYLLLNGRQPKLSSGSPHAKLSEISKLITANPIKKDNPSQLQNNKNQN